MTHIKDIADNSAELICFYFLPFQLGINGSFSVARLIKQVFNILHQCAYVCACVFARIFIAYRPMRSAVETSLSAPMQTALSLVIQISATDFQAPNKFQSNVERNLPERKFAEFPKHFSQLSLSYKRCIILKQNLSRGAPSGCQGVCLAASLSAVCVALFISLH